jgi:hypothetical protein
MGVFCDRSLEERPISPDLATGALLTYLVVYIRAKRIGITQILNGKGLCGRCFICLRPHPLL